MLIGANAGGKNLRNIRIGDGREAVRDGARGGRVFLVRHFAKRHDEGEDAVLVVVQIALVVARLDVAEAQCGAVGEAQSVDGRRDLLAEGHQAGFPARLHAGLVQLLGERNSVGVAGDKHVQVLLLQLAGNADGVFLGWSGAYHRGEAGSRAVDELDAALADDDVGGRSEPNPVDRIRSDQILAGFDDLEGKQRRHSCVQRVPQVGQPDFLGRNGRQQPVAFGYDALHVGKLAAPFRRASNRSPASE